jgi:hypothetical protein
MTSLGNITPAAAAQGTVVPGTAAPSGQLPAASRLLSPRVSFASLLREEAPKREAVSLASGKAQGTPGEKVGHHLPAAAVQNAPQTKLEGRQEARGLPARPSDDDPLDPIHRHRAALAPPDMGSGTAHAHVPVIELAGPVLSASPTETTATRVATSLEDLMPALVRRVAWSGDGRRGTVRMELGSGELSGATLLVHADEGRVRVVLEVPPGVDAQGWKDRIAGRLASCGIAADSIEVS